jgi:hypothetical protein
MRRVQLINATLVAAVRRDFDRVVPHYNARGADANWFSLPDQGSVESALLDRERRGVQP